MVRIVRRATIWEMRDIHKQDKSVARRNGAVTNLVPIFLQACR